MKGKFVPHAVGDLRPTGKIVVHRLRRSSYAHERLYSLTGPQKLPDERFTERSRWKRGNRYNFSVYDKWPFENQAFIRLAVYVYLDSKKADRLLSGGPWERPELSMFLFAHPSDPGTPGLGVLPHKDGQIKLIARDKAVMQINRGTITLLIKESGLSLCFPGTA